MITPFIKEFLKTLVTLGMAAASIVVGGPLAIMGCFNLYGFMPGMAIRQSFLVGVLMLGAAGFIWWVSAVWLAWCGGRARRFTLRGLILGVTLAALYFGIAAMLISRANHPRFTPAALLPPRTAR
jgi:hypothetical protein